jgi:hypothetical protein
MSDAVAAPNAAPAGAPGTQQQPAQQPNAAAQKPGETAAQAQARMLKLVLDGKEVELPESEVLANYRKGKDASKLLSKVEQRRQEALRAKAEADGLLSRLKADPISALRDLGVDVRALSEKTILEDIELEKMTPAERRAYEAEKKLKAYEAEKQKAEEEKQRTVHEQEVARHKDEFASLFMETMEATGLPKSSGRYVLHRMASLYAQNEEAGLESTPEEMATHVLEGLKREHTGVLSGLDGDRLLEYLGPDVVKKVLGAHLARINAKRGRPAQPTAQVQQTQQQNVPVDDKKGRWAFIEKNYLAK